MNRRTLLRSVAASTALSIGVGSVAGRRAPGEVTLEDVDELYAVRNGEVVAEVSNPSDSDLADLRKTAGAAGEVVTSDDCCIVECVSRCADCIGEDGHNCCHFMRDDC